MGTLPSATLILEAESYVTTNALRLRPGVWRLSASSNVPALKSIPD